MDYFFRFRSGWLNGTVIDELGMYGDARLIYFAMIGLGVFKLWTAILLQLEFKKDKS